MKKAVPINPVVRLCGDVQQSVNKTFISQLEWVSPLSKPPRELNGPQNHKNLCGIENQVVFRSHFLQQVWPFRLRSLFEKLTKENKKTTNKQHVHFLHPRRSK